ncbi:MAG: 2-methylthioadenine synthetase [Rhodospirillaceae bacterium]|nr:MAG: 2-methylthioadenine synthetase [Rhodospirillaceae bacterium]
MPPSVVTFGCRTNTFESEVMRQHAVAAGLSDSTVIINTCAVTGEAERQARQTIRRLKRERPGVRILVTGCAAQLNPERFAAMPEVERVLGNAEKLKSESWRRGDLPSHSTDPAPEDPATIPLLTGPLLTGFAERTRAFLPVQQGCDHRCTFCIIPLARGKSRSLAPAHVVAQARALTAAGYRELVLTGIDLTAYGLDLAPEEQPGQYDAQLGGLVERVLAEVPGLERLRLSSLDPVEIDAGLLAVFGADRRVMPHIHLSVQAGDDLILKRMKRRHTRADVVRLAERLRALRPEMTLGADLIAGFPTENEALFANTLRLVEECGLTHVHVFPFSARPDTPAARMPAVPGAVVRERAALLRTAAAGVRTRFLETRIGTGADVLVERSGFGHSEDYLPVQMPSAAVPGFVTRVRLVAADATGLYGDIMP